jgi:hypothetical protein
MCSHSLRALSKRERNACLLAYRLLGNKTKNETALEMRFRRRRQDRRRLLWLSPDDRLRLSFPNRCHKCSAVSNAPSTMTNLARPQDDPIERPSIGARGSHHGTRSRDRVHSIEAVQESWQGAPARRPVHCERAGRRSAGRVGTGKDNRPTEVVGPRACCQVVQPAAQRNGRGPGLNRGRGCVAMGAR